MSKTTCDVTETILLPQFEVTVAGGYLETIDAPNYNVYRMRGGVRYFHGTGNDQHPYYLNELGFYEVVYFGEGCCPGDGLYAVDYMPPTSAAAGGGTTTQDAVLREFVAVCLTDRISSDPLELKTYYEIFVRELDGTTFSTTSRGFYEDKVGVTPYTPVDPVDASTLGDDAVDSHNMTKLEGASGWTSPALVRSYSVTVYAVGDINSPPTFTDSDGVVTQLPLNVAFEFHVDTDLLQTPVSIQTFAGDGVLITSTKYTT